MKKLLLTLALLGALSPQIARAQDEPIEVENVPVPMDVAGAMATVTPFIENLKEPQGMALDGQGNIVVCDYGAGEVLRFDKSGANKEVLASNLKGPTQIISAFPNLIISERKANRVISLSADNKVIALGGDIIEPMGLLPNRFSANYRMPILEEIPNIVSFFRARFDGIYAVAHTTSKIYQLKDKEWKLVYAAPDEDGAKGRYGLRCLANYSGSILVSDEVGGDILMISRKGRAAKFASGFDDPSGMEVRGDWLYVCDEGNGGQLWKVDKNGRKTLVAEKLGRPRNVLFLNDNTALVSDRDGRVLKLSWAN